LDEKDPYYIDTTDIYRAGLLEVDICQGLVADYNTDYYDPAVCVDTGKGLESSVSLGLIACVGSLICVYFYGRGNGDSWGVASMIATFISVVTLLIPWAHWNSKNGCPQAYGPILDPFTPTTAVGWVLCVVAWVFALVSFLAVLIGFILSKKRPPQQRDTVTVDDGYTRLLDADVPYL